MRIHVSKFIISYPKQIPCMYKSCPYIKISRHAYISSLSKFPTWKHHIINFQSSCMHTSHHYQKPLAWKHHIFNFQTLCMKSLYLYLNFCMHTICSKKRSLCHYLSIFLHDMSLEISCMEIPTSSSFKFFACKHLISISGLPCMRFLALHQGLYEFYGLKSPNLRRPLGIRLPQKSRTSKWTFVKTTL